MNIQKLLKATGKPEIYTKGTAEMWSDEHISKFLLKTHLSQETDLASRNKTVIKDTVDKILNMCNKENMNILDLGCGPGLYAELLSKKGHKVTGIDFSKRSIEYAEKEAENENLDIKYIHKNYLDIDFENEFDLVIIIYCDFGVLVPSERKILLKNIYRALKPGGLFVFDALNENIIKNRAFSKNWEIEESGFWKDKPYVNFTDSYHYENEKVILDQYTICDKEENIEVYRMWNHYFSDEYIKPELLEKCFKNYERYENFLSGEFKWNRENVSFFKVEK